MQAVQVAVHNSIRQLSGSQVAANAVALSYAPEERVDQYKMQARTREELLATQPQAAQAGHTNPLAAFASLNDPAAQLGGAKMVQVTPDILLPDQNQIARPVALPPQAPTVIPKQEDSNGWSI